MCMWGRCVGAAISRPSINRHLFCGRQVAAPTGTSCSDDEICARYWAKKPSLCKRRCRSPERRKSCFSIYSALEKIKCPDGQNNRQLFSHPAGASFPYTGKPLSWHFNTHHRNTPAVTKVRPFLLLPSAERIFALPWWRREIISPVCTEASLSMQGK